MRFFAFWINSNPLDSDANVIEVEVPDKDVNDVRDVRYKVTDGQIDVIVTDKQGNHKIINSSRDSYY